MLIQHLILSIVNAAPPSPASSGVVSEQEYNSRSSGASSPPLPPPPPSDSEMPPAVPPHFLEKGMLEVCHFIVFLNQSFCLHLIGESFSKFIFINVLMGIHSHVCSSYHCGNQGLVA